MASKRKSAPNAGALVLVQAAPLVSPAEVQAHTYTTRWNASVQDASGQPIAQSYRAWVRVSDKQAAAFLPVDSDNASVRPFVYALDLAQVPGAAQVVLSARVSRQGRAAGNKTRRVVVPIAQCPVANFAAPAPKAAAPAAPRQRDPQTGQYRPSNAKAAAPKAAAPTAPAPSANANVQALVDAIAHLGPEAKAALKAALG